MNNQRIIDWVDGLFAGFAQTDKVREQKEELQSHITDRVKEHMADSMDFDRAFAVAKEDLGDLDELLASFDRKKEKKSKDRKKETWVRDEAPTEYVGNAPYNPMDSSHDDTLGEEKRKKKKDGWSFDIRWHGLVALSPFIFLGLGFAFNWWAWAWMIIPVSAILFGGKWGKRSIGHKLVAVSPFIFLALGFAFGWWAWGWIVIPVSAILFGSGSIVRAGRD